MNSRKPFPFASKRIFISAAVASAGLWVAWKFNSSSFHPQVITSFAGKLPALKLNQGQILKYNFTYTGHTVSNPGDVLGIANKSQVVDFNLSGAITFLVLNKTESDYKLYLQSEDIKSLFSVDSSEIGSQSAKISQLFKNGFALNLGVNGKVNSIQIPNSDSEMSLFAKSFSASIQFITPSININDGTWQEHEWDSTGKALTRYQITNSDNILEGTKEKLKYEVLSSVQKTLDDKKSLNILPHLTQNWSWNTELGFLKSLSAQEKLTMRIGTSEPFASVDVTTSLVNLEDSQLSAVQSAAHTDSLKNKFSNISEEKLDILADSNTKKEHTSSTDKKEISSQESAMAKILSSLNSSAFEKLSRAQLNSQHTALQNILKENPDFISRLDSQLLSLPSESNALRFLIGVLGSLTSTQSQDALVRALRARNQDTNAVDLFIPALGFMANPTQDAQDEIYKIATSGDKNSSSTAFLSLGLMAHSLGNSDDNRASEIISDINARLSKSKDANEQELLLGVLGNAGSIKSLETIKEFLNHKSPEIRAQAALALRRIDSNIADELLIERLKIESETWVKGEILESISNRKATSNSIQAQISLLNSEKNEGVKMHLLKNLWMASDTDAKLNEFLKSYSSTEKSNKIRKYVDELLATSANSKKY